MPLISPELTELTTTSPVSASFDWVDLASGTGFISFFGASATTGGFLLTTQSLYSNHIETASAAAAANTDPQKMIDLDFPSLFRKQVKEFSFEMMVAVREQTAS